MNKELIEQINAVVDARRRAQRAIELRTSSYQRWEELNQPLIVDESDARDCCLEAEAKLRELTLQSYAETENKAPAVGVGIREQIVLIYDSKVAFDWAKAHKIALKLDTEAFKKIAKADPPDFVKITTEPQATIATELVKVDKEG